jgi:uncharacterized membrane protein YeiH
VATLACVGLRLASLRLRWHLPTFAHQRQTDKA